jgi:hypothetical protein
MSATSYYSSIASDIADTTNQFEKIFAISLPERTDRRDGLVLAGAVSDIDIEFIDGVRNVSTKSLPPHYHEDLQASGIGAWRAHLNAIQE